MYTAVEFFCISTGLFFCLFVFIEEGKKNPSRLYSRQHTSVSRQKKSCTTDVQSARGVTMFLRCKKSHNFTMKDLIRVRGYKTFFMLNSVEHEILNAHK